MKLSTVTNQAQIQDFKTTLYSEQSDQGHRVRLKAEQHVCHPAIVNRLKRIRTQVCNLTAVGTNPMLAICHTLKNYPQSLAVLSGCIRYVELRLVPKPRSLSVLLVPPPISGPAALLLCSS